MLVSICLSPLLAPCNAPSIPLQPPNLVDSQFPFSNRYRADKVTLLGYADTLRVSPGSQPAPRGGESQRPRPSKPRVWQSHSQYTSITTGLCNPSVRQ